MTKTEKCLAKLYFALGEKISEYPTDAENSAFMLEFIGASAVKSFPEALRRKYFLMGASSFRREAAKPPRGKKEKLSGTGKGLPPKSRKQKKKQDYEEWEDYDENDYE